MLEILISPWHWSVAGVLIGLTVPALLILGNRKFGISSSLRHICAACLPANIPYFKYNWKREKWNFYFIGGIVLGGFIAQYFLTDPNPVIVASKTATKLAALGITNHDKLLPPEIFSWDNLFTFKGFIFIAFGGFLVGFGTRYAGGCTSGHSISGLANLQWPSLVATICFMIGGIVSANFLIPFILK
jgi:uncharacterized membrane protein YedE/YeeE